VPSSSISSIAAFPTYLFVVFVVPVIYGSWRFTLFHFVTGPAAAYLTTRNPNEFPAVWCLFSLGLLLVVMTPLRRQFFVTKWIIWPARWRAAIGQPGTRPV
jgi:hypothetical protein